MSSVIFLLGAGASVDAGMPDVRELTQELRNRLLDLRDMNLKPRHEFLELFECVANYEPAIKCDYERFFEWLRFLRQGQTGLFRKIVKFILSKSLIRAAPDLEWKINVPIWQILRARHLSPDYSPGYFGTLGEFVPERGSLRVFTTNFDLCVEDGCGAAGVKVNTGFSARTGCWNPASFRTQKNRINLYKLHGSLNWRLGRERYPPNWDEEPEVLLGPGSKLHHDDPYVTLYAEFQQALRKARVCVTIGCGFRDDHITLPIRNASRRGTTVIEVNPTPVEAGFDHCVRIQMGAKEALERGLVARAIRTAKGTVDTP